MAILADVQAMRDRIVSHSGPASYVTIATTGDVFQASEAGYKNVYHIGEGVTSDGLYEVYPQIVAVGPLGGGQQTVKMGWYVAATGLEVAGAVNLSGSSVALRVVGN